jgi:hypothetical protein
MKCSAAKLQRRSL